MGLNPTVSINPANDRADDGLVSSHTTATDYSLRGLHQSTWGLGKTLAFSAISGTLCSHSMAIR